MAWAVFRKGNFPSGSIPLRRSVTSLSACYSLLPPGPPTASPTGASPSIGGPLPNANECWVWESLHMALPKRMVCNNVIPPVLVLDITGGTNRRPADLYGVRLIARI